VEDLVDLIKRQRDARLTAAFTLFFTAQTDDKAKEAAVLVEKLCLYLNDDEISVCKEMSRADIFYHSRFD